MPLSTEARNRIFIATTDKVIGNEISDAIDQGLAVHVPSYGDIYHAHLTMMRIAP